jgi:hypothetical protein
VLDRDRSFHQSPTTTGQFSSMLKFDWSIFSTNGTPDKRTSNFRFPYSTFQDWEYATVYWILFFSIPMIERPFFYQYATVYWFLFFSIPMIERPFFLPICYSILNFVFLYTDDRESIFLPIRYGILIFVFAYIVATVNFSFIQYTKVCWYLFFTISMI